MFKTTWSPPPHTHTHPLYPSYLFFLLIGLLRITGFRRLTHFSHCFSLPPCTAHVTRAAFCAAAAPSLKKTQFPRACLWICAEQCRSGVAELPECVTSNDRENTRLALNKTHTNTHTRSYKWRARTRGGHVFRPLVQECCNYCRFCRQQEGFSLQKSAFISSNCKHLSFISSITPSLTELLCVFT